MLRPEPGNARTAALLEGLGLVAIRMPLFAIRAVAWAPPDPAGYDALLVTSANAPRHAGERLDRLRALPVVAVGAGSAAAARAAGLRVAIEGDGDARAAIVQAAAAGYRRLLHLAGRDRTGSTAGLAAVTVYASEQVHDPEIPAGAVVLVHSARAARTLARVDRASLRLVALSAAVLAAAAEGWASVRIADAPTDAAMAAAACALAIDPCAGDGDNAA